MFINGFLALTDGTGTEIVNPYYARQAISFQAPVSGVFYSANNYAFDTRVVGWAGRAIYDAPTGGNLLLSAPLAAGPSGRLLWDRGEAGTLRLVFTAMILFSNGEAFSGIIAAGAACGTANDNFDEHGSIVNPTTGFYIPQINTAPLTAGVALTITRGVLRASSVAA